MRMTLLSSVLLAASLGACATFPELDATITAEARKADYPSLLPTSELQADSAPSRLSEASNANFDSRISALRARASRLRGSVVDSSTKRRMNAGVTEPDQS